MKDKNNNTKITLVLLWVVVLFNMIFADIFSSIVEIVEGGIFEIPGDVKTMMAIAAILTNIPILMIVFSWVLSYKINRLTNMITSVITIVYVVGGGVLVPHYIIIATIEVVLLIIVFVTALKWKL